MTNFIDFRVKSILLVNTCCNCFGFFYNNIMSIPYWRIRNDSIYYNSRKLIPNMNLFSSFNGIHQKNEILELNVIFKIIHVICTLVDIHSSPEKIKRILYLFFFFIFFSEFYFDRIPRAVYYIFTEHWTFWIERKSKQQHENLFYIFIYCMLLLLSWSKNDGHLANICAND